MHSANHEANRKYYGNSCPATSTTKQLRSGPNKLDNYKRNDAMVSYWIEDSHVCLVLPNSNTDLDWMRFEGRFDTTTKK